MSVLLQARRGPAKGDQSGGDDGRPGFSKGRIRGLTALFFLETILDLGSPFLREGNLDTLLLDKISVQI